MDYSYDRTDLQRTAAASEQLSLKNLTSSARAKLWDLDEKLIGTADYMGIAYFWDIDYKWWLRDASPKVRQQVHNAFRKAGLRVDDSSLQHRAILGKFFPDALKRLSDMDDG